MINYLLAKNYKKKIHRFKSPKHDTFQYVKRKALILFKTKPSIVVPNRTTFEKKKKKKT